MRPIRIGDLTLCSKLLAEAPRYRTSGARAGSVGLSVGYPLRPE